MFPVLVAALVLAMGSPGGNQQGQKPSLAGHWVYDSKPLSANDGYPQICERECTIVQDANMLKVTIRDKTKEYKLDGTLVVTRHQVGEYSPEVKTTTRWEGQSLLIAVEVTVDSSSVVTRSKLSLTGDRMAIEVTSTSTIIQSGRWEYKNRK
jgi:hypothetical protein